MNTDNLGLKVPILSIDFRANIPTTKSQIGNSLGVSRIRKVPEVENANRSSVPGEKALI